MFSSSTGAFLILLEVNAIKKDKVGAGVMMQAQVQELEGYRCERQDSMSSIHMPCGG